MKSSPHQQQVHQIQQIISAHVRPFGWLLFLTLAGNVPQSKCDKLEVFSGMSHEALSQHSVHWDILKIETRDRLKGVEEISLEWPKDTLDRREPFVFELELLKGLGLSFMFLFFLLNLLVQLGIQFVKAGSQTAQSTQVQALFHFKGKNFAPAVCKKYTPELVAMFYYTKPIKDCVLIKTMKGRQGQ